MLCSEAFKKHIDRTCECSRETKHNYLLASSFSYLGHVLFARRYLVGFTEEIVRHNGKAANLK